MIKLFRLTFSSILLLSLSCTQDDSVVAEAENTPSSPFELVVVDNENQLLNWLNQTSSSGSARTSSILDSLDLSEAVRYTDSLGNAVYSLYIPESDPKSLKNVWLYENEDGELTSRLLHYQIDSEWYASFDVFPGWGGYSGTLDIYSLDGELIYSTVMKDGTSLDQDESGNAGRGSGCSNGRLEEYLCVTTTSTLCGGYGSSREEAMANTDCWTVTQTDCYWFDDTDGCGVDGAGGSNDPAGGDGQRGGVYDPGSADEPDSDPVACDDPEKENVKGRCVLKCGEGMVRDESGSCTSIEGLILDLLEHDPYALLQNCELLSKWQSLAQNEASPAIKDKINQLQQTYSEFEPFAIQTLNNAGGMIVNMDYFSVNLTIMPINSTNGQRFSPTGFLNYIRRNINSFVSGSTFEPYCQISSLCNQETNLWNSSDPMGAILYIDMPMLSDGSVICSEYTSSYWYFMTLEAPGSDNHPVSGTRQFGFEQQRDGSYDFFVRGVDRFDSNVLELSSTILSLGDTFSMPDALWESFQNRVNEFINSNRGTASISDPVKYRPDWEKVKDVLEGRRPLSDLGCN